MSGPVGRHSLASAQRHRARGFGVWFVLTSLFAALCVPSVSAKEKVAVRGHASLPLVRVPGGEYRAPYADRKEKPVLVAPFLMMTRPVTNAEFLAFVRSDPSFRRDHVPAVLADARYLSHWTGPLSLGVAARRSQPVTRVSWFTAKAFCESRGLRLPLEREWELAAAASETQRDGRSDPRFRARVLSWYASPGTILPDVPQGPANVYGLRDLHAVVWEWVWDFADATVSGDGANPNALTPGQFCGSAAPLQADPLDYATYMRFALRGSLEANYTGNHLGFRCAADLDASEGHHD
jgi:formylglycine-generating enzyme required for sulfatase activity